MNSKELHERLILHELWLQGEKSGLQADFSYEDLEGLSLKAVNLHKAIFYGAHLYGACLDDANLSNANLENSILKYAYCRNTNFKKADLTNANFTSAIIENCDFDSATLNKAIFNQADLSTNKISNAYGITLLKLKNNPTLIYTGRNEASIDGITKTLEGWLLLESKQWAVLGINSRYAALYTSVLAKISKEYL